MEKDVETMQGALKVIDSAFEAGAEVMVPLFSGGHDSLTATFIASFHPKFAGDVFHINTGIGAKATRRFVEEVCREYGWNLHVYQGTITFEQFVRERGFPGPGRHQWVYNRLKDHCVQQIMKHFTKTKVALITGCRADESTRRMGNVESLKIGEIGRKKKKVGEDLFGQSIFETVEFQIRKRWYWTAPCHDWSSEKQQRFMQEHDLPINPIKQTPLGMSGECFCGAFARPNEIALIRQYAPDVADEIDRLAFIAKQLGTHAIYGTRPAGEKGIIVAKSGPLCNSCDARAMAAGLIIDQREMQCDIRDF